MAGIYSNKLRMEGFLVELALDGKAGLAIIKEKKPDLVILDLMLPNMNGVEILKRLRSQPETKTLPIIVFSNSYLSNMVEDAWKAGANSCLSKSGCTAKQLIEVINKALAVAEPAPAPVANAPVAAPASFAAVASAPQAPRQTDASFQAELRQAFLTETPQTIAQLRTLLQAFTKSENEADRLTKLFDLYRKVHSLTSNAAIASVTSVATMSAAVEALIKELHEKPKSINPSTLRTLAAAVDFLNLLVTQGEPVNGDMNVSANVLVVDDEPISRRAVTYALERGNIKSVAVDDTAMALKLLQDNQFDLIFLDVFMPGMDGFEMCKQLRALPNHAKTPVIFVTSLADFDARAKSSLSGGNDLIAKPFLFMELTVKALIFLHRARMGL